MQENKELKGNGGNATVAQPLTAVLKSRTMTGTTSKCRYMNGCIIGLSHSLLRSQEERSLQNCL